MDETKRGFERISTKAEWVTVNSSEYAQLKSALRAALDALEQTQRDDLIHPQVRSLCYSALLRIKHDYPEAESAARAS